jgi:hypothetical protein
MKRTRNGRFGGYVGVATLLAVAMTGCGVSPSRSVHADAAATAKPLATARTVTAEHLPRLSSLAPGTVIATGSFSGGTTGRIEIKANGADHGFDVSLTGLYPAPAAGTSLELNAEPPTASDTAFKEGFSYYRYDPLGQVSDQTFSGPSAGYGGFETNDPRYLRTAVIWSAPSGTPIGLGSIVATAALTWDLPTMSPGPEIADHGPAEGARGKVVLADDGAPISYRIASSDTANGIATRFGITTDDLKWLNPDRYSGRLVLADITINLSRELRGIRS